MPNPADAATGELLLTSDVPGVVLDTNVVLDWLVFRDPAVAALAAAVEGSRLRWLTTAPMRQEMAHVLGRGLAAARSVDTNALLAAWDALSLSLPEPAGCAFRCADPDDQKFVDLAVGAKARWLVSRDRAVLKLHRRALALGLSILTPERWEP